MPTALLAALLLAAEAPPDPDFEVAGFEHALTVGPIEPGRMLLSGDLGWLRSGVRFDIGLGVEVDLVARLDAFLLEGVRSGQVEQASFFAGLRVSPLALGRVRLSATGEIGEVIGSGTDLGANLLAFRGELAVGVALAEPWLAAARVGVRSLKGKRFDDTRWQEDAEVALALERRFGRLVGAAEGSTVLQPGLAPILQWRLRVGLAL